MSRGVGVAVADKTSLALIQDPGALVALGVLVRSSRVHANSRSTDGALARLLARRDRTGRRGCRWRIGAGSGGSSGCRLRGDGSSASLGRGGGSTLLGIVNRTLARSLGQGSGGHKLVIVLHIEVQPNLTQGTRITVDLSIHAKSLLDSSVHVRDLRGRSRGDTSGGQRLVQVVLGSQLEGLAKVLVDILVLDKVGTAAGGNVGDASTVLGPFVGPESVVVTLVRSPVSVQLINQSWASLVVVEAGFNVLKGCSSAKSTDMSDSFFLSKT